ncbi:TPA: hypothetical protein ACGXMH_001361 [Bacillus mobilis]
MTRFIIQDEKYKDEILICKKCNHSFARRDGVTDEGYDFCSSNCAFNYDMEHHPNRYYQTWKS